MAIVAAAAIDPKDHLVNHDDSLDSLDQQLIE